MPHPGNSGEIWRNQRGGPLKSRISAIFQIRKSSENPEISKSGLLGLLGLLGFLGLLGLLGFRRVGRRRVGGASIVGSDCHFAKKENGAPGS